MKKILLVLVLILFLLGCEGGEEEINEEVEEVEVAEVSECDKYTTDYIIQRCKAIEAEEMSMCDPITHYGTREDCILVIAELVQDDSQLSSCELSRNSNYEIICKALIKKDVNECFAMEEDVNEMSDTAMRDCIDLVARKLRDKEVCEVFVSRALELKRVCGDTNSCEGEWVEGASYHKEDCEMTVEAALSS